MPPLKYKRYTANSDQGYSHIFIKFDSEKSHSRLPDAAFEILQDMKTLDGYPTGLKLVTDKLHGKVWRLPDNPVGRTAADIIDARLGKLAAAMTQESLRQR